MNDKNVLNQLKKLFADYPEIIVAYFYGSQVTGYANKQSDLDLAAVQLAPSISILNLDKRSLSLNQISWYSML